MTTLIIGAGLAGLSAARELTRLGHTVHLIDKGRGVGGRLATRRLADGRADHGAQYFSARSPEFKALTDSMMQADVVREWHLEQSDPASFQHPRYVGAEGMTSVAKYLANGLSIETGKRVTRVNARAAGWEVVLDDETTRTADALLLTLPAPQALALWEASGLTLSPDDNAVLAGIVYEPCLAVMLRLTQVSHIPTPGGLKQNGIVSWLADNQQKGISPAMVLPTVTLHASHAFSRDHLDDADLNALIPQLIDAAADFINPESVLEQQIHRWRFSNATVRHDQPFLAVSAQAPLLFGGDGFGQGNVEGAFLSGLRMAQHLAG